MNDVLFFLFIFSFIYVIRNAGLADGEERDSGLIKLFGPPILSITQTHTHIELKPEANKGR